MRNPLRWKSGILSLLLLGLAMSVAHAQMTVTGTVTSEEEGPIPGVNIVIQGTTTGTVTMVDGTFTIEVPDPDAVLVFSAIGYSTQAITVGNQTTINVLLEADVTALDEIVVIGYGTQKKKEVTSSVANVKSDEFVKGDVSNPAQLIQGKVAGLSISKPGGDPNADYTIRLRGLNTVGANTQPLVVIDGVIGGSLDNVDPNDIESIDVLKDGSAAAIYGTRGSAGVILVTTKQGRRGTTYIDYSGQLTHSSVAKYPDVMTAEEWRELREETGVGTDFGEDTEWFKETTNPSFSQTHNLSMSGGNEKTKYRASINFRDQNGVALNTGFTQLNGRLNLQQRAINDKLTIDLNIGATQKTSQYGYTEAFRYASIYNPTAPVTSDDPAYDQYDGYFQQVLFDYYNPVSIMELNEHDGLDKLLNAAVRGSFEIIEGLKVDAFYSLQTVSEGWSQYIDKNSYWQGMDRNGIAHKWMQDWNSQLFESTINYTGYIGAVNLTVLGGYSYQEGYVEGFEARGGDFINDAFTYNNLSAALDFANGIGTVNSWKRSSKLIAFFGRVNLNLSDSWFVMASARYEGSSRFGVGNQWGLFPAVGAGVDLANFFDVASMDNLKVRVSYGITGQLPPDPYLSLLRLGPRGNFYYNGEFVPGYAPVSNANEDLAWERKGEFNAGVDYSFLDGRLFGALDFYTRTTTDLLFTYDVPVPPNIYREAWMNLGEIQTTGLELALNWNVVESGNFTYGFTITPTWYIQNKLVSLSGEFNGAELIYGVRTLGGMGAPGQSDVPLVKAEEGGPIGEIYTHTFVEYDSNGNLILQDTNEDGTVDPADRVVTGNGLPDAEFGFANNFRFGNFDANLTFRGVIGHDLINTYRGFYEVPMMMGSYNLPTGAMDQRSEETGTLYNASSGILSSTHVEDASFVSIDNVTLGYNFDLAGGSVFRSIRIYLAGNNLLYITGYKGTDPNVRYADGGNTLIPGVDRRNTWFPVRSISLGVNLGL